MSLNEQLGKLDGLTTTYRHVVDSGDYAAVVTTPPQTFHDNYVYVRRNAVLGQFIEAEAFVETIRIQSSEIRYQFVSSTLAIYKRESVEKSIETLLSIAPKLTDDPFLMGECNFALGFAHGSQDLFAKSLLYFRLAMRDYLRADLLTQATVASFNSCVCLNHLGRDQDLCVEEARLRNLAATAGTAAAQLHAQRFELYRMVDSEAYADACVLAEKLLAISLDLKRYRTVGSIAAVMMFLFIKLGREEDLHEFVYRCQSSQFSIPKRELRVIHEFSALAQIGSLSQGRIQKMLQTWRDIDSVHRFHLFSNLLDLFLRTRELESAKRISAMAMKESLRHEQLLHLIDFEYYHIKSMLLMGQTAAALPAIERYHRAVLLANKKFLCAKIMELRNLYARISSVPSSKGASVVINRQKLFAYLSGKTIDLNVHPTLYKALLILTQNPNGIALAAFFSSVYSMPYNPIRHERRVAGLIERCRRIFARSDLIIRSDGMVRLGISVQWEQEVAGREERRKQILTLLAESGGSATMVDLTKKFPVTKRMMQLEIKILINAGDIRVEGVTKSRRYFLKQLKG